MKATLCIFIGYIIHVPTESNDRKLFWHTYTFFKKFSILLIVIIFILLFIFNKKKIINPNDKFPKYIIRISKYEKKSLLLLNIKKRCLFLSIVKKVWISSTNSQISGCKLFKILILSIVGGQVVKTDSVYSAKNKHTLERNLAKNSPSLSTGNMFQVNVS